MTLVIATTLFSTVALFGLSVHLKRNFVLQPTLGQVTLLRDVIFLTLLPYIYYLSADNWLKHYIFVKLPNSSYFITSSIFVLIFVINFVLIYILTRTFFKRLFTNRKLATSSSKLRANCNILIFVQIIYYLIFSILTHSGVWNVFLKDTFELQFLRFQLTQGGGAYIINKIIMKTWLPPLILFRYYLELRQQKFSKNYIFVLLLLGFVVSFAFFEKSGLFIFLMGIVAAYIAAGNKLSLLVLFIFSLFGFSLIATAYYLIDQDRIIDSDYLLTLLVHRVTSQSTGSVMSLHYFENHHYFGMAGISNIWAKLAGTNFQSVYGAIIDYYIPETAEISGAMSSFVTGDAYGLFGIYGVVISGCIVGLYYGFIDASLYNRDIFTIVFPIYITFFSYTVVAGAFYSFLWPIGYITQIIPFLLLYAGSQTK